MMLLGLNRLYQVPKLPLYALCVMMRRPPCGLVWWVAFDLDEDLESPRSSLHASHERALKVHPKRTNESAPEPIRSCVCFFLAECAYAVRHHTESQQFLALLDLLIGKLVVELKLPDAQLLEYPRVKVQQCRDATESERERERERESERERAKERERDYETVSREPSADMKASQARIPEWQQEHGIEHGNVVSKHVADKLDLTDNLCHHRPDHSQYSDPCKKSNRVLGEGSMRSSDSTCLQDGRIRIMDHIEEVVCQWQNQATEISA